MLKENLVTQGVTVGKYRIEARIAEGGMGVFWRARDTRLDRTVGLKTLHTEFAVDAQLRDRFINEARALAKLNHPNICVLHDFFEAGEQLYIVMEYIEGETLANLVRKKSPLGRDQIVPIFRQILLALDYAHNHGVIHRDIKPSNILVSEQGMVKVMDFGIAKMVEAPIQLTRTGRKMGSLLYMSPEQIREQPVDHRSDLYSLGVTLYQVCTGRVPFDATSEYDAMKAHLEITPASPRSLNPSLPEDLEYVIVRAMSKRPQDRFQSAMEMRKALGVTDINSTSDRVTIASGEKTRIELSADHGKRKSKKHGLRWVLGLSALVAVSLAAVGVAYRMGGPITEAISKLTNSSSLSDTPRSSVESSSTQTASPASLPESTALAAIEAPAISEALVAEVTTPDGATDEALPAAAESSTESPANADSMARAAGDEATAESSGLDAFVAPEEGTQGWHKNPATPEKKPRALPKQLATPLGSGENPQQPQIAVRPKKPVVLSKYHVSVVARPTGWVQLDGQDWGREGGTLEEGYHRLEVMAAGFPMVTERFQLKGDTTITVDLEARSAHLALGDLRISARAKTGEFPPCRVKINGAAAGMVPGLRLPLKAGEYEIELTPPAHMRVDSLVFQGLCTRGGVARIQVPPQSRSFARFYLSGRR
jgi:serine/threonine protein kinase